MKRPPEDRSRIIIAHEKARSERLITAWESEVDAPLMNGPFNYPQMVLATWLDRIADRPSLLETVPPIRPRTE